MSMFPVVHKSSIFFQAEKFDKLEKADILELTVKYVKQLQRTSVKGKHI